MNGADVSVDLTVSRAGAPEAGNTVFNQNIGSSSEFRHTESSLATTQSLYNGMYGHYGLNRKQNRTSDPHCEDWDYAGYV